MMLLYPDMSRELYVGNDNFTFAAPCLESEWHQLYKMRDEPNRRTDYLPFTFIYVSADNTRPLDTTCIILMSPDTPDSEAIETAAWIRVTEECSSMIYALTFVKGKISAEFGSIVARTAGVDPKQVRYIDLQIDLPTKRKET